jgi:hypothetical protein
MIPQSMVPTVGAFDTHICLPSVEGINGILIAYAKKKAKNIHNCSVAVKFNLYKS